MAYLMAVADGNLTAAGTWAVVDATSLLDSEAASSTALTTTYALSSAFTPGAITIDGIGVKPATVVSGTATVFVALDAATVTVPGTEVSINITDFPVCSTGASNNEGGIVFFKFAVPVLLLAATPYTIKAKLGAGTGSVNLYRDATAANWSRLLRTTTTQAPTAADLLVIAKEWTAAGTGTARTVTMDSTSATAVLVGAGASGAVNICKGGTISWGTTASTAYKWTVGNGTTQSDIRVYSGGTWLGNAPPASSSHDFVMNVTATTGSDGLSGFIVKNGGTATGTGATVTTTATTLTTDASAADTSIAVVSTAGWANGDSVALASKTRTTTETETKVLGAITDGTHAAIAALSAAHGGGGTTGVVSEVYHLTRNIKMRSNQTALGSVGSAYVDFKPGSIVSFDYVEFAYLGANTATQRGIEIETTTGSCSLTHCSLHDCRNYGLYLNTGSGNMTVTNLVSYNLNTAAAASTSSIVVSATTGVNVISFGLLAGQCPNNGTVVSLLDAGSTYGPITVAGSGTGAASLALSLNENGVLGTINGLTVHSNAGHGLAPTSAGGITGTIGSSGAPSAIWRNGGNGVNQGNGSDGLTLDSFTCFGNTGSNFSLAGGGVWWLKSCVSRSDIGGLTTTSGLTAAGGTKVYLTDCDLGTTTTHTQDINISTFSGAEVYAWNTKTSSGTPPGTPTIPVSAFITTVVRSHKYNQGAITAFESWSRFGQILNDNTHLDTGQTTGIKCLPNANASAARPFIFPGPTRWDTERFHVLANPGTPLSLALRLWQSGYALTGVTLHIVGGVVAGVGSWGTDLTIASTSTTGAWQTLTTPTFTPTEAGEIEFYLSADSSTTIFWLGYWTLSAQQAVDTTAFQVISRGLPSAMLYKVTAGGGVPLVGSPFVRG